MIGEVVLALQAVNALASAVSESAGHASTLGGIVGKLTKTNEAIQTAEANNHGRMSQKEALDIALAKKRCQTIQTQIRDHLMLAGLNDVLQDMDRIMSESRIQHEKDMAASKKRKAANRKLLSEIGQIIGIFGTVAGAALAAVWAWVKFK
tara:strand:- start:289 stop:738 length:450 start_codon:yes stop_codon:yes gene_type:complete